MDIDGGQANSPKKPMGERAREHGKRRAKNHDRQAKGGKETQRAKEDAETHPEVPKTKMEDAKTHTRVPKTKPHTL